MELQSGFYFTAVIFEDESFDLEALMPHILHPNCLIPNHSQSSTLSTDYCIFPPPSPTSLPPLLNPLLPLSAQRHADIFALFPSWEGPLEEGMLIDFLGIRTPYEYDCEGYTPDNMRCTNRSQREGRGRDRRKE